MLIPSDRIYIEKLVSLWESVFGDERGYIELFFNSVYKNSKTFAAFDGEMIVSVLYLLPSEIKYNNKLYSGYYLYAAATEKSYRKRGLMARLINEAKEFAASSAADYIALVPATDRLCDYYEKFGFYTAMYKSTVINRAGQGSLKKKYAPADSKAYLKVREKYTGNMFLWGEEELQYVLDCFAYYNIKAYCCDNVCFIADVCEDKIHELIVDDVSILDNVLTCDITLTQIACPYGDKHKFGMICPIKNEKFTDIYMNLALD